MRVIWDLGEWTDHGIWVPDSPNMGFILPEPSGFHAMLWPSQMDVDDGGILGKF